MLEIMNRYKIRTTDNTLNRVRRRVMNQTKENTDDKSRVMEKMTAFHKDNPAYFKMYIRLFGQNPHDKKSKTLKNENRTVYTQRLGLNNKKGYTQNNVNLAYTQKSDENLPMSKSPKTQRALKEEYAKLTKHIRNQSVYRK